MISVIEALDASTFCIQSSPSLLLVSLSQPKFELHQAKSVEYKAIASAIRIDQSLLCCALNVLVSDILVFRG